MSVEIIIIVIWLTGWLAATVFAAVVIGNVKNSPSDETETFPTFIFPLCFGWMWPAALAIALIVAPLAWLSDRATARQKEPQQ